MTDHRRCAKEEPGAYSGVKAQVTNITGDGRSPLRRGDAEGVVDHRSLHRIHLWKDIFGWTGGGGTQRADGLPADPVGGHIIAHLGSYDGTGD